jgi:hypothetical protein
MVLVASSSAKAALQRLTEGELSLFSLDKLAAANLGLDDNALVSRFVRQETLSAREARLMFGHLPTSSGVGSTRSPYAIPKATQDEILRQATIHLNPTTIESQPARLERLQREDIGSILLVGQRFGSANPSEANIILVSAPTLATVGNVADDLSGVLFSETWDDDFLKIFPESVTTEDLHTPLFGFLSGEPRSLVDFKLASVFAAITAVMLPTAELLAQVVGSTDDATYRAFFFPLAANVPAGMSWPLATTAQDLIDSLIALKGDFKSFAPALQAIEPMLARWLNLAQTTPDLLKVPYALHDDLQPGFSRLDLRRAPLDH